MIYRVEDIDKIEALFSDSSRRTVVILLIFIPKVMIDEVQVFMLLSA